MDVPYNPRIRAMYRYGRRYPRSYAGKLIRRKRKLLRAWTPAGSAWKRALYNPRASLPEVKSWDGLNWGGTMLSAMNNSNSLNTGSVFQGIAQGTTANQRIGSKICVKSVHYRGTVTFFPLATGFYNSTAVLYVVLDTQSNGSPAAVTDVLVGSNPASPMINLDNSSRFRVLKAWRHTFNLNTPNDPGYLSMAGQQVHVDMFIPMNLEVTYSGTNGLLSEIRDNSVFLLYGCTNDNGLVQGVTRVRFTDA